MKKKTILMIIFLFGLVLPYMAFAQQKAEIANPVFTFDPVPEGVHVDHVFIVKNTGDTILRIEKVSPP
jgi:hypothetical protein